MKVYQTNEIKNIALVGSAGSGKTTLAESMLFESGVIKRRGSVEAKNNMATQYSQQFSTLSGIIRNLISSTARVLTISLEVPLRL